MEEECPIDMSKLTRAERGYIASLQRSLAAKELEIASKDARIRDAERKIRGIEKALMNEKEIVKRYNLERFFSRSDNAGAAHRNPVKAAKEAAKEASGASPSPAKQTKKRPGRPKGSKNFGPDFLASRATGEPITLDIAKELLSENPGLRLRKIRDGRTYIVSLASARLEVREVIIPIYKGDDGAIYRAESPSPLHHSVIASSLLSDAIAMKYFLGVPEDRYSKWLAAEGMPFSQRTLNNWALSAADALKPFVDSLPCLFSEGSGVSNVHIDETTLTVIEDKGGGREKSYVFAYSADAAKGKVRVFEFSTDRTTGKAAEHLKGYKGCITVDGYAGYDSIASKSIKIQRCLVHLRRRFSDIVKTVADPELLKESAAFRALGLLDEIFASDRSLREAGISGDALTKARTSKDYLDKVAAFNTYLRSVSPEQGTPLAEAIGYWRNLCPEFWTYLKNPSVVPDNSEAERQVKKFVIDRKNFLFSKTERGAEATCHLMTVIDLASENGLDPRGYLEFLLDNHRKLPFEDLLPWSPSVPISLRMARKK